MPKILDNGRGKDVLMIAGILAALVIFFYKFVFFGMIPINADWLVSTFHPWKTLGHTIAPYAFNNDVDPILYAYPVKYAAIEIMKHGALPLWNPYILCGCPLWGNTISAPLDPMNVVFFMFDFAKAWGVFLMLQFAAAGVGTYLFACAMGMRRLGAAVAGLAFMLHTSFVVWYQTLGYLGPYCWLPLAMFASEMAFRKKSIIIAFWCGLLAAFFFWSGMIQIAVYSAFMLGAYILFRYIRSVRRESAAAKRYTLIVIVMFLTLTLYVLPELIVEHNCIANSTRTADRYHQTILYPQMLVSYLSPYFYGTKFDGWDLGYGTYIFNRGLIRLNPPYIGMLPLFLALIGFISSKRNDKYFYLLFSAGIIGALLLLGAAPVYKLVIKIIPFFGSVDHYRIVSLYAFSMALMAGWGVSTLLSHEKRPCRSCAWTAITVFLSVVIIFLGLNFLSGVDIKSLGPSLASAEKVSSAFLLGKGQSLKSVYKFVEYLNLLKANNGSFLFSKEAVIPMVFAAISMIMVLLLLRPGRKRFWIMPVIAFIAFDLLYYAVPFPAYSSSANVYPSVPSMSILKKSDYLNRVCGSAEKAGKGGDMFPPNTGMLYGLYDIRGYENASQPRWYYKFLMGDDPDEIVIERFNDYDNKFIPFLGVRYFLTDRHISSENWKLAYDGEIKVYESARPFSRVFIAPHVRYAKTPEDAYAVLKSPSFDPASEVVVETSSLVSEDVKDALPVNGSGSVAISVYKPNEVIVKTDGKTSGMLVLSDTFFPGWRAFVGGKERPVLKADYAFRAVRINEGERSVRFIFRPRHIYELLCICAALFVFMLAVSAATIIKRR